MMNVPLLLGAFAFLVSACVTVPLGSSRLDRSDGLVVLLEGGEFDGHSLTGRLLIGASAGKRQIDVSVWPFDGCYVRSIRACDSHEDLPLYVRDGGRLSSPSTAPTTLSILPGDWYGRDLKVTVSLERVVKCAEVDALIRVATGDPGAEIPFQIRASQGGEVRLEELTVHPAVRTERSTLGQ